MYDKMFSTYGKQGQTENEKKKELSKGSAVNSLFFDLIMLRIERHQISVRNGDDDDHHSFIGSIVIAITRFLSPEQSLALPLSLLIPFLLDYRVRAEGKRGSNIK